MSICKPVGSALAASPAGQILIVLIGLTQHGAQNAQSNGRVILSERSESKDLRTNLTVNVTIKAKILRLHSASLRSAQDDNALHYAK